MEENENSFKNVTIKKSEKNNFVKTYLMPFISGIIGASLVIGVCFGIPNIREKIFVNNTRANSNLYQNQGTSQSAGTKINATAISLEGYSETSMGVAEKVLPSIVGIQIEYSVSSFFGLSSQSATGSGIIISEDRIYFDQ